MQATRIKLQPTQQPLPDSLVVEHPLDTLETVSQLNAFRSRIKRLIICQVNNYHSGSQPTQIQTKKISNKILPLARLTNMETNALNLARRMLSNSLRSRNNSPTLAMCLPPILRESRTRMLHQFINNNSNLICRIEKMKILTS